MTNIVEDLKKHSEELQKIGLIICILNRIESNLHFVIEIFFCDFNQFKHVILNDAFFDKEIFPTLENKRKFLLKIIDYTAKEAEDKNMDFDEQKWRNFCKSIQVIQEIRNKLAHNLLFFQDGKTASHICRKKPKRIREEKKQDNKSASFITEKIDLNDAVKKTEEVFNESQKFIAGFTNEAMPIIASEQKLNITDL